MSIPPVPQLAARLDLALLQSEVLNPHLVADRMLDRDWEHISPRLVAGGGGPVVPPIAARQVLAATRISVTNGASRG